MTDLTGYHHVSLTVPDIDRSTAWYCDVLGFTKLKDFEGDGFRKVILLQPATGLAFGFTDHGSRNPGQPFSEFHTGLDHLAFAVADRDALLGWVQRFDERGVEHSGIKRSAMGDVIIFRDPDGIQLEVYANS